MQRKTIVIVTPALADANNGNWQTARRWARMLRGSYGVRLASDWHGGDEALTLALHARRSAAARATEVVLKPQEKLCSMRRGGERLETLRRFTRRSNAAGAAR
ncbi:MAG: hypothetical protein WAQ05_21540, partial [Rubrivivax sp.]